MSMSIGHVKKNQTRNSHAILGGLMLGMVSIVATGCGGAATAEPGLAAVSGRVFISKGVPLTSGRLVLKPVGGLRPAVTADVRSDGSFAVDGASQPAAVLPGDYEVYVVFGASPEGQALARRLPRRLQSLEDDDSGLVVRIDGSAADVVIELKRG